MSNNLKVKKPFPKAAAWVLQAPNGSKRFTSIKDLREFVDSKGMVIKKSKEYEKTYITNMPITEKEL